MWGGIHRVGDDIWAVVSTVDTAVQESFTTLCNGGIVAGRDRVLVFEGFGSPEGSSWVARHASELTGRAVTDVVVSHQHGDHHAGLAGFGSATTRPTVWATATTRDIVLSRNAHEVPEMLEEASVIAPDGPTTIDLGGRPVVITPYAGHTESDIVARVDDTTFCGDLLWIDMIPNFIHATPIELGQSVDAMLAAETAVMVSGHGPLADRGALEEYRVLLDVIEAEGRRSFEAGDDPKEAAAGYEPPASLADWSAFGSYEAEQLTAAYYSGILAWHRQLGHP